MPNIIRLILSIIIFISAVALFVFGEIGWGILVLLISLLFLLTYFRNENIMAAFWFLRKENFTKARSWLDRIKNPERSLIRRQQAYYYFLIGLTESQKNVFGAEKNFKKALSIGLKMDHDIAMAKLGIASAAMARRNKREAQLMLAEAKKYDKNKLLADHIKMMTAQLGRI